jgi:PE family
MLMRGYSAAGKLAATAGELHGTGSAMSDTNSAAVATTEEITAIPDEVSGLRRAQSAAHAAMYQSVNAQHTALHELFVTPIEISAVRLRLTRPPI